MIYLCITRISGYWDTPDISGVLSWPIPAYLTRYHFLFLLAWEDSAFTALMPREISLWITGFPMVSHASQPQNE